MLKKIKQIIVITFLCRFMVKLNDKKGGKDLTHAISSLSSGGILYMRGTKKRIVFR